MKVDFHVHSTASDGTLTPGALAMRAMTRSFDAMAITDHDNCDGVKAFSSSTFAELEPDYWDDDCEEGKFTVREGVLRFGGIELSIEPGIGFDRFHLLGLGIDPDNAALKAFLAKILASRNERNARILENFSRIGIPIPPEELHAYAHGEVLARPHFAQWLVAHGHAKSVTEAFALFLLSDSPAATRCYERRYRPTQEEAFAAIHGAGGITIMAHPKYWRSSWKESSPDYDDAEKELFRLKEAGLDGIEAVYGANLPREDVAFTMIAEHTGLLKSAGSDFHGANKPNIRLGMTVEDIFIRPLLERLGRKG